MNDVMPTPKRLKEIRSVERRVVAELGANIGFGNMMHLASEIWGIENHIEGISGGEFVVGPCKVFTVPCGCGVSKDCDWCAASGWLTPHVKEIQDQKEKK